MHTHALGPQHSDPTRVSVQCSTTAAFASWVQHISCPGLLLMIFTITTNACLHWAFHTQLFDAHRVLAESPQHHLSACDCSPHPVLSEVCQPVTAGLTPFLVKFVRL